MFFFKMKGNFIRKLTFLNFCEIWAKIIQYRNTNIYGSVNLYEMKKNSQKSIFMNKYVKNCDFCIYFGNMTTKK